jgi:hypothetical protein
VKPRRALPVILAAAILALSGATAAEANTPRYERQPVPPLIRITSAVACTGVITIGWDSQRFDLRARAWAYWSQPGDDGPSQPPMTLQGQWKNHWYDLVSEGGAGTGSENHIRYIGKAVTAFRIFDRLDNTASSSWPLEALADC